jgi:hypothetical protein
MNCEKAYMYLKKNQTIIKGIYFNSLLIKKKEKKKETSRKKKIVSVVDNFKIVYTITMFRSSSFSSKLDENSILSLKIEYADSISILNFYIVSYCISLIQ